MNESRSGFKYTLRKKKVLIPVVVAATLLIGGGVAYFAIQNNQESQAQQAGKYHLYSVQEPESIIVNGEIVPKKVKTFTADGGTVSEVTTVESGKVVQKDAYLYTIRDAGKGEETKALQEEIKYLEEDIADLKRKDEEAVAQAKKEQDQAQKEEEENGLPVTPQTPIEAPNKDTIADMQKQLSRLRTKLANAQNSVSKKVYAPFTGTLYKSETEGSENEVLTLESTDYYVKGAVSEQNMTKVKAGIPVKIHVFTTNKDYKGKIESISTRPLEGGQDQAAGMLSQYGIRISVENGKDLISGFHVQGKIVVGNGKVKIPLESVVKEGEETFVFVEENGTAVKRVIKGKELPESKQYEIASGLKQGEIIITNPMESGVKEGDTTSPELNPDASPQPAGGQ